jgi:quercetin dioxygenase-like cupin family protein
MVLYRYRLRLVHRKEISMTHDTAAEPKLEARTPGAHRAQKGEHVFDFGKVNQILGGPDYSPVFGGCIEGDRMIVALMTAPAGKMSEPHSHPNEQWIFVLEGVMELIVDGQRHVAHPGEVVYIPANMVHCGGTSDGKDAKFFTVKDAVWGLHGIKEVKK